MNKKEDLFDKWKSFITDEWLFTELCNKVIWFNIPKDDRQKFIPYGAKKTKDKGVDAELEGTFIGKSGNWIFQYKYFDLSKNPQSTARSILKSKLFGTKKTKSELEKAAELMPSNYAIFTNIQLTKHFRDEIDEKLIQRNFPFEVNLYDIDMIENLILECPIVELSFFGERPLYTLDDFSKYYFNKAKPIRADMKLYGREEAIEKFNQFINGEKSVLVLSGPGGVGKTHFAVEMGQLLNKEKIQPFYLKIGAELKRDDILKISQTNEEVALLIDDAHEFANIHQILKLVSFEKFRNIKIILTTRTQLIDYLTKSSNPEDIEYISLRPLSRKSMVAFLKNELDIFDFQTRLRIFKISGGLPLFAILCYKIIKENKLTWDDLTKDKIIEFWINNYLRDLPAGKVNEKVLEIIAAIEPITFDDKNLLKEISKITNLDVFEIQDIIKFLIDSNYLKKYGRMIKIEQDIVADYLLYDSTQKKPDFLKNILEHFLQLQPTNVLTNLSKAEQLGHVDLLSDVLKRYYKNVSKMNIEKRLEIVEALEVPAFFRPTEVIKIVEKVIKTPAKKYKHRDRIFGEIELRNLNVIDKLPSVLKNLSFSYDNLEKTMELLREVALIESTPDNYSTSAKSILRYDVVGFQGLKDIIFNEKAIAILDSWTELNNTKIDELIVESLKGIFASEIHVTLQSDESANSFQLRMYKINREKVSKLRLNAIYLLFKLANENRKTSTRIRAINGLIIWDSKEKELDEILKFIGNNLPKEKDLLILHAYYTILKDFHSFYERKSKSDYLHRIDALTVNLENSSVNYKLYRWLVGLGSDYDHMERKDIEKIIENLSIEASKKLSPQDLSQLIIAVLEKETTSNSINFARYLGINNPIYAKKLIDFFLNKEKLESKISKFIGSLLLGLEKSKDKDVNRIIEIVYQLKGNWWNIIVEYFYFSPETFQNSLSSKIRNVSIYGNQDTKLLLASYMRFVTIIPNNEIWWEIVGNLSKSEDEHLLRLLIEALFSKIGNNEEILKENIELIEEIIGKFKYSKHLAPGVMEWHYLGKLMNLLVKIEPEWVYSFLENRIISWANRETAKDFIPIPYGNELKEIFIDIQEDNDLLEKTIIWILRIAEKGPIYAFEASILFSAISTSIDAKTQKILLNWAKDDVNRLFALSYVLRECKKDDGFWRITEIILDLSKGNKKVQDSLSAAMGTTGAIVGSFIPILEEREKVMKKWEMSPKKLVQNFAKREIESIEKQIQYHKNEEEEIFDE